MRQASLQSWFVCIVIFLAFSVLGEAEESSKPRAEIRIESSHMAQCEYESIWWRGEKFVVKKRGLHQYLHVKLPPAHRLTCDDNHPHCIVYLSCKNPPSDMKIMVFIGVRGPVWERYVFEEFDMKKEMEINASFPTPLERDDLPTLVIRGYPDQYIVLLLESLVQKKSRLLESDLDRF